MADPIQPSSKELRNFIRSRGVTYLRRDNITSIGIGYKQVGGQSTGQVSIQFTVAKKFTPEALESIDEPALPTSFLVGNVNVPTDVLQRSYRPAFEIVPGTAEDPRKKRLQVVAPGISVGSTEHTGTLGAIVYDNKDGAACALSNWHVLQGEENTVDSPVYQPGPRDDGELKNNRLGALIRGYLAEAGDCAIARIDSRKFDTNVFELGSTPTRIARAELNDRVVKCGRTTGITHAVVSRVDVISSIDYGGNTGFKNIGGFELKPDPARPPNDGEISSGGDSGAAWLAADANGKASDVFLGLHFAGETGSEQDEHALACYAHAVFTKLNISLTPKAAIEAIPKATSGGFDIDFLGQTVSPPEPTRSQLRDAVYDGNHPLLRYTHFSILMSRERKIARYGAWNVNGAAMVKLGKSNDSWRSDDRAKDDQIGSELYDGTVFDKGHICKREDLVWGRPDEARQANNDSFHYTNCSPQHHLFNRGSKEQPSIWKGLEDEIIGQAKPQGIRLSVFAGPIFRADDPPFHLHRSGGIVKIPREYWKVVVYTDEGLKKLVALGFILTQSDLVLGLEALDLSEFQVYQRSLAFIESKTELNFGNLKAADPKRKSGVESFTEIRQSLPSGRIQQGRDIEFGS